MNMTLRGIHDHIDEGFQHNVLLNKRKGRGVVGIRKRTETGR